MDRTASRRRHPLLRIAIDIGGTFTDFIVASDEGRIFEAKVPSRPQRPDEALEQGLNELAGLAGYPNVRSLLEDTRIVIHGTTVAINAILQMRGVKTGLLCTSGFRDALEIRLGHKEERYVFSYSPPPPLVPRHLRISIDERVDKNGHVRIPLADADVVTAARALEEEDVEAIAICFLWSFLNSEHERRAEEIVRELLPNVFVTSSHEVLPKIREYNRTSTTVLNAYIGPIVESYVDGTEELLRRHGFTGRVRYIQSNGGLAEGSEVKRRPVVLLMSGPAAAPAAALHFRELAGDDLITIDMGGTSFDTCLVRAGLPDVRSHADVNRYRAAIPLTDVHTIGAGGGSVARLDEGLLRVGPESAEAYPGPACYGRGGIRPTVTDANVVTGLLNQSALLGGRFPIDAALSRMAVHKELAVPAGMTPEAAAVGVIELVSRDMADAIREITVRRGHDPRDFTLVVGGGAGGIHAAKLAQELEIRKVVIPRVASAFCAFGAAVADLRHDYTRSCVGRLQDFDLQQLQATFEQLESNGRQALAEEGIAEEHMRFLRSLDLRYKDQVYECTIDITDVDLTATPDAVSVLEERFHRRHEDLYDFSQPGYACEVISLGLSAIAPSPRLRSAPPAEATGTSSPEIVSVRSALFERGSSPVDTPVFAGESFTPGHTIHGPAIIEETHTTIVIPPGVKASFQPIGAYLLELEANTEATDNA